MGILSAVMLFFFFLIKTSPKEKIFFDNQCDLIIHLMEYRVADSSQDNTIDDVMQKKDE